MLCQQSGNTWIMSYLQVFSWTQVVEVPHRCPPCKPQSVEGRILPSWAPVSWEAWMPCSHLITGTEGLGFANHCATVFTTGDLTSPSHGVRRSVIYYLLFPLEKLRPQVSPRILSKLTLLVRSRVQLCFSEPELHSALTHGTNRDKETSHKSN
jgi:hypothetical protein